MRTPKIKTLAAADELSIVGKDRWLCRGPLDTLVEKEDACAIRIAIRGVSHPMSRCILDRLMEPTNSITYADVARKFNCTRQNVCAHEKRLLQEIRRRLKN